MDDEWRELEREERRNGRWRRYRLVEGFYGLGVTRSPAGWAVQIGPWVWTTE